MQFNTWGIGRRDEIVSTFEPERFAFIERVRAHLDLEIVEIKGNGEPVQIALGERANPGDPEAAQARVTPFFSSFDALDFFCRLNLQSYLAFDPQDGLPRHWFWEESRRRRQSATGASVSAGQVFTSQSRHNAGTGSEPAGKRDKSGPSRALAD